MVGTSALCDGGSPVSRSKLPLPCLLLTRGPPGEHCLHSTGREATLRRVYHGAKPEPPLETTSSPDARVDDPDSLP